MRPHQMQEDASAMYLGLPSLQNCELNKLLFFINDLASGTLLQQQKTNQDNSLSGKIIK
jgi:hypothetical protein